MRIFFILLLILMILCGTNIFASAFYNVKDFGASGDGNVLETAHIQKAIDKAFEDGGGTIVVPPGTYKIGCIVLKDNINLYLESGAILKGSPDINDYTEIIQDFKSRTNKLYAKYFMIYAEGANNISITGQGIINGNGVENFQVTRPQNERPFLMRLVNCENVIVRDIQLLESANWTFHLLGCKEVIVDGIKIFNSTKGGNRDGLDIDACKNVTVSNCRISSQDDAIVLKATNDIVCENITITNCVLSSNASAIKTGTESNGGFKNITINNCVIKDIPVHAGIELMTVDGGDLQNITISNIVMDNVATPIFVYLGNRARPFKKGQYVTKVSEVCDIYFDNITVTNAILPSGIVGLNNKTVKNISFNNISIRYSESLEGEPLAFNKVPYMDLSYPMARMYGVNLPAYAFYCRNVEELSFNNVRVYSAQGEKRPAFVIDKVNDLELFSVKSSNDNPSSPMVYLRNSSNTYSTLCRTLNKTACLFEMEKNNVGNIHFVNNFLQKDQNELIEVEDLEETILFADINPEKMFTVENGGEIDGLMAQEISVKPIIVEFEIAEKVTPQLCLLIKNNTVQPEKVRIKYNGIEQEFVVDWDKWGWAPIALTQQFSESEKVSFRIEAVNKNSRLMVSKVHLKNLKLGYTD